MKTTEPSGNKRRPALGYGVALAVLMALVLGSAAGAAPKLIDPIELRTSAGNIPEAELIDVGIQVFDPGMPEEEEELFELEDEKGIFEDVRNSEARYCAVRLMETLQSTGFWGAVRVVPAGFENLELAVSTTIVEASGKRMILEVQAVDVSGRVWLEKKYKKVADIRAYRDRGDDVRPLPFQNLYNQIANDLAAVRDKRDSEELTTLREISNLRFAADIVPAAYDDYLGTDKKGRTVVTKLPSPDDPMIERIELIRERDYMFIDTLTEYYANFAVRMDDAYGNWLKFSHDEIVAAAKVRKKARMQKALGIVAILGGIAAAAEGGQGGGAVRDVGIIAGSMVLQNGIAKSKEVKMHTEALRELAASLEAEVTPLLVDVEGQTLRLTGSAEKQYEEWRRLLRQIFANEMGLPVDPDTGEPIPTEAPAPADNAAERETEAKAEAEEY